MNRYPNIVLAGILLGVIAVGAFQGSRIDHIRESEAFYRWLTAAGTNERLFQDENTEFQDKALYEQVRSTSGEDLAAIAGDDARNEELWEIAKSQDAQRTEFLNLARNQKLQFATNLAYTESLAGNVSVFNIFFGFRKVAANFIWLQVDRFWHQGMMHRMIPLMWSCVTLDPNFVDAYLLGAWHLAYNVTAKMPETPQSLKEWSEKYQTCMGEKESYYFTAIDFLKDGILHNPRNYKLYFDLGFSVYSNKLKDYTNSVKYLSEAVRVPHERWVPRMLYKALEDNKQYEEALIGWQQYMERFPETTDVPERSIQRNQGLLAEQRGRALLTQADAATDPAQAEQLRAQAQEQFDAARAMWQQMNEEFANARLLILDAENLAKEGRYLEAIGFLDKARYEIGSVFEEASDLIIAYKQAGGIPLSLSEKKAVLREEEGDCKGKPAEAQTAAAA